MIKMRSTRSLSSSNARSKSSASFSPKKVMSGYGGHRGGYVSRGTSRERGKKDLHNPRRVIREIGFIFFTLVIIPPTVLPLFLPRLGPFLRNLRIFDHVPIPRITNLAQRNLSGQDLLLNLRTDHFPTALNAGSGSERPVTLQSTFYPRGSLKCVNVLSVVLFVVARDHANCERAGCSECHDEKHTRKSYQKIRYGSGNA